MSGFQHDNSDQEFYSRLEIANALEKEWKTIRPLLVVYASRLASYLLAMGVDSWSPEDLLQEAMTRLLEGKRKWPKNKNLDLKTLLMGIMRSIVSSHIMVAKKYPHIRLSNDELTENNVQSSTGEKLSLEEIEERKVLEHSARNILMKAREAFMDDPIILLILDAYNAGIVKPGDLTEVTGSPINEIYIAKKRLQRWVENNKKELLDL